MVKPSTVGTRRHVGGVGVGVGVATGVGVGAAGVGVGAAGVGVVPGSQPGSAAGLGVIAPGADRDARRARPPCPGEWKLCPTTVKLPLPLVVIEPVNFLLTDGSSALFFLRPMRFGTRHLPGGPTVGPGSVDSSGSGSPKLSASLKTTAFASVPMSIPLPSVTERTGVTRSKKGVLDRHAVRVVGLAARKSDRRTAAEALRVPGSGLCMPCALVTDVPLDIAMYSAQPARSTSAAGAAGSEQDALLGGALQPPPREEDAARSIAPPRSSRRSGSTTANSTSDLPPRPNRARRRARTAWTRPRIGGRMPRQAPAPPWDGRRPVAHEGQQIFIAPARK